LTQGNTKSFVQKDIDTKAQTTDSDSKIKTNQSVTYTNSNYPKLKIAYPEGWILSEKEIGDTTTIRTAQGLAQNLASIFLVFVRQYHLPDQNHALFVDVFVPYLSVFYRYIPQKTGVYLL
jgi:hypothetical protein